MGQVRLGELVLRWCRTCNVPILRQKHCNNCGGNSESVPVTPPGDIRPAFEYDIDTIRKTVSAQFGENCGSVLIPDKRIVILNRAPGLDTIDEIIMDGAVIGSLIFDVVKLGFKVIMRLEGAGIISDAVEKGYVVVDDGATAAILKGGSVLIPGILEISEDIEKGDEIIVFDTNRRVIATGPAKMSGSEIKTNTKGSAVKTRWYGEFQPVIDRGPDTGWDQVITANRDELRSRVDKAIRFIKNVISDVKKPVVVSFSGGKDSLATLLLVLETGEEPDIIFINTGLELPETVSFTNEVAEKYDLNLIVEDAGDSFWKYVDYFGPPGKDFRWCCKTSKLGPASRLIKKNYPGGVLSFIGQRAYESEPRAKKGHVWKNPWVPGQYAASPIQKWTALHIWLYLFSKDAPINPWYKRGLDRIGCWLCPASNLSELQVISENFELYQKWEDKLRSFIEQYNLDGDWLRYGLWRWRKHPKELISLIGLDRVSYKPHPEEQQRPDKKELHDIKEEEGVEVYTLGKYQFISLGGFEDCQGEVSLEGAFNFDFDFDKACNLLNILGAVSIEDGGGSCSVGNDITLFRSGNLSVKGMDKKDLKKRLKDVFCLIIRSMDCVECGICISSCVEDALRLENGLINLTDKCIHCKKCLSPCTVTDFGRENVIEF